jgi:hypothetical protein
MKTYNSLSDQSVETDEEIRPVYRGLIQPYMFELTMTSNEAVESDTTQWLISTDNS